MVLHHLLTGQVSVPVLLATTVSLCQGGMKGTTYFYGLDEGGNREYRSIADWILFVLIIAALVVVVGCVVCWYCLLKCSGESDKPCEDVCKCI